MVKIQSRQIKGENIDEGRKRQEQYVIINRYIDNSGVADNW